VAFIGTHESTKNVPSTRGVIDISRKIAYVNPDAAPLTVITMKASGGSPSTHNTEFKWIEKDMLPAKWDQNTVAATTGDTVMTVADGSKFHAHDIIEIPVTGEVMRVTSVATNVLTVVRGFGRDTGTSTGTAAATVPINSAVLILGQAYPEGASVSPPWSYDESYPFNYTQIFRLPFGPTGSEEASEQYTGPDRARLTREKAVEHKVDIERSFLTGERRLWTTGAGSNDAPLRIAGGLDFYLNQNLLNIATLTAPAVETWLESVFQATGTSDTRLFVCSPRIVSVLDNLGVAKLQTVPREKTFGVAIKEFVTAHGTLMVAKHRLLINGQSGVTQGYAGQGYALDMGKLRRRPLRTRDTSLLKDRQAPGDDKFTDEYLTECGFQVENPQVHGKLTGVTG
jgi:hypothetical protein